MNRRTFLCRTALLLATNATAHRSLNAYANPPAADAADGQPFSRDWLRDEARQLAAAD